MAQIFVSSLPFKADEAFLRGLFEPYGRVSGVELHADWINPMYEPYAHVELDVPDPTAAIEALDGLKFGQNHIRVHRRVPVPEGPRGLRFGLSRSR